MGDLTVTFRGLDDRGDDVVKGTVSLAGGGWPVPRFDAQALADGVMAAEVQLPDGASLTAAQDPERWLRLLHAQFRSPYLRASPAEGGAGPSGIVNSTDGDWQPFEPVLLNEGEAEGGTCKVGETAKQTGCVPAGEGKGSAKAARAKLSHKLIDKSVQRYAEEHNEPAFAALVGGVSLPDSEPVDVARAATSEDQEAWGREAARWKAEKASGARPTKMELTGFASHGFEMKTMVDNANSKITMDSYSQVRKILWEKEHGATFHTVVIDDHAVYDANGPGQHDESKRVYLYRRGVAGSARIDTLYRCKDAAELLRLIEADEADLPPGAQRTDGEHRKGRWKAFQDAEGKGFKNSKTGKVFRAKK